MAEYVALLRAINVAGHARVKMSELKKAFSAAGCRDVRTFIQSGNVVFAAREADAGALSEGVRITLRSLLGEEPTVLFRSLREIRRLTARNPFEGLDRDRSVKLYVTFLERAPGLKPKLPLISPKERLEVIGIRGCEAFIVSRRKDNGFYGFPNNFIEKELGVLATSRNWSTVSKLASLGDA